MSKASQVDKHARLQAVPIDWNEAMFYVDKNHRHHKAPVGHKFSIGAAAGDEIVGVVIVGRPVNRVNDDGMQVEVTRLCTNGHPNACSFLYGRACKAAFAMGYRRVGTYTLPQEGGTSLRAAGFKLIGQTKGGKWDTPSRPRVDTAPTEPKFIWERTA